MKKVMSRTYAVLSDPRKVRLIWLVGALLALAAAAGAPLGGSLGCYYC